MKRRGFGAERLKLNRAGRRARVARMDLAGFIQLAGQEPPLRFLVIGGYAVAAHGHARATFDVDFLARKADLEEWKQRANGAGLKMFAASAGFAQFTPSDGGVSLDLMVVNEGTFEQFWAGAEERELCGVRARLPSLDHLLALKLHVLKQGHAHRGAKDADDVEMLLRRNKLDLRSERGETLFLKYGNREILKPSPESSGIPDRGTAQSEEATIELPEGSEFRPLPPLVSVEEVVRLSEQMRRMFPESVPTFEQRWAAHVREEFEF